MSTFDQWLDEITESVSAKLKRGQRGAPHKMHLSIWWKYNRDSDPPSVKKWVLRIENAKEAGTEEDWFNSSEDNIYQIKYYNPWHNYCGMHLISSDIIEISKVTVDIDDEHENPLVSMQFTELSDNMQQSWCEVPIMNFNIHQDQDTYTIKGR